MMSSITFSMIDRRPRAPVSRPMRLSGDGLQGLVGEMQIGILHAEEVLILLREGVLWVRSGRGPATLRRAA